MFPRVYVDKALTNDTEYNEKECLNMQPLPTEYETPYAAVEPEEWKI